MPEPLTELSEDFDRGLAVVAHPDDLEYGAAAAIARWTDQNRTVSYLLVTRGEAGIATLPPGQAALLREAEQRAAAALVGVAVVEFLDHPDGIIEYGLRLRRDIAAAIRRHRPQLVLTANHHPVWPGGALNSPDHRHVGQATVDAVADAANEWIFPDLSEQGLEPWTGVQRIAVAGSPFPTHAVDVSTTLDRAVDSLRAHRVYLEALGDHPMADAANFLHALAAQTAHRFGGRLVTSFQVFDL